MLQGFRSIVVCVLASSLTGCGGDDTPSLAYEGLSNRYLWQVGNCEMGALTPVNPETGETQVCGGNAREVSECVGAKVFKMIVEGNVGTMTSIDGSLSERVRFERTVDCASEPSLDNDTCLDFVSALGQYDNLYVGRMIDRAPEDQLYADGLWMAMGKPWPGRDGCAAEPTR
jgi:hypothetical protein